MIRNSLKCFVVLESQVFNETPDRYRLRPPEIPRPAFGVDGFMGGYVTAGT